MLYYNYRYAINIVNMNTCETQWININYNLLLCHCHIKAFKILFWTVCLIFLLMGILICKVFMYIFFFLGGGFYNEIYLFSVGQHVSSLALVNNFLYAKTPSTWKYFIFVVFFFLVSEIKRFLQHKNKILHPYLLSHLTLAILLQLWA